MEVEIQHPLEIEYVGYEGLRNLTHSCNKDDGVPPTLVVKELIDVRFHEVIYHDTI